MSKPILIKPLTREFAEKRFLRFPKDGKPKKYTFEEHQTIWKIKELILADLKKYGKVDLTTLPERIYEKLFRG